ncbi:hypothetical protein [Phenylobacterium sp.]|uniref:hypothetical protein n=1 Tax=Phenylobacterium sp. TaxID=1871053 RepID=UPI0035AED548
MPNPSIPSTTRPADPAAYAVLRRGGATPEAARAQLALDARKAEALESLFAARVMGGGGEQTPRFARHAAHVRAVMAEGGFPALVETRASDGRPVLTAKLAWPDSICDPSRRHG